MLEILYYPEGNRGPVRDYFAEGLRSQQITVRPLGDKLWELKRLYDGIQYRIFFGVHKGAAWLVHSIEKKSAKTPKDDLEVARKRLREVMAR